MDLDKYIRSFKYGSRKQEIKRLSKIIGVCENSIEKWRCGLRQISVKHLRLLISASDGKITKKDMRPDIYS